MIDALKLGSDVTVQEERDVLGGVPDTGVYPYTIKAAYLNSTKSGAVMAMVLFEDPKGRKFTLSECIMSKKSGNLKATYTDKNGKEQLLPGYSKILNIFHTVVDPTIADLSVVESETKTLKLYDYVSKTEVPTDVPCFVQLHGKNVELALYKEIHTKMEKDSDGKYTVPTNETREVSNLDKLFNSDGLTLTEIKEGDTKFKERWLTKHLGKSRDKTVKGAGVAGAPKAAGSVATPELKFS